MRYLTLFVLALIFLGCSKEKSKKWLIADITVLDEHTGEPMECDVTLKWTSTSSLGVNTSLSESFETDAQGKVHIEREVSRKDKNFRVDIWPDQTHYGFPGLNDTHKSIALEKKSSNTYLVRFPSKSYVVISIMNTNCTGPTDSLFMISTQPNGVGPYMELAGCVDTIINEQMAYSGYIINPILQLDYVVKRGLQIDTIYETHVLTPKEFTPISINY